MIKNLLIILYVLLFNILCAQITVKKPQDAYLIETHQSEFIGKPLQYILSKIDVKILSVLPIPNKNKAEVSRLCFRFVTFENYLKTNAKEMADRPTQICITFNQNWNLNGDRCTSKNKNCFPWTEADENNLGDLIVSDIYVTGKD